MENNCRIKILEAVSAAAIKSHVPPCSRVQFFPSDGISFYCIPWKCCFCGSFEQLLRALLITRINFDDLIKRRSGGFRAERNQSRRSSTTSILNKKKIILLLRHNLSFQERPKAPRWRKKLEYKQFLLDIFLVLTLRVKLQGFADGFAPVSLGKKVFVCLTNKREEARNSFHNVQHF